MTIDNLFVDLKGVFDNGMTYVSLSRCKCLDGLYLKRYDIDGVYLTSLSCFRPLDRAMIKSNDQVKKFYAELGSKELFCGMVFQIVG